MWNYDDDDIEEDLEAAMGNGIDADSKVLYKDIVIHIEVVIGRNKTEDIENKEDVQTVQKEKNSDFDNIEVEKKVLEIDEINITKDDSDNLAT